MSEQQSGWLKRMMGGDTSQAQLQGKLQSTLGELENAAQALRSEQEQSSLKDKEIAGLRETLEGTTARADQFKQELSRVQRELEQAQASVLAERNKGEQQKAELERALSEAKIQGERVLNETRAALERSLNEAKATGERARLLAEAEKLKSKSAYSQVQGLEKRTEALQQQCTAREQELVQVKATLANTEAQLVGAGDQREELRKKTDELTKAKSEWASQRAGLDATLLKQRSRQEEQLQKVAKLEADLNDALEKQRSAEETSRTEKQALVQAKAELDRARKTQELLVREERVRWTLLVNRMWKALERSLGKAALVSMAGAFDGDETLERAPRVSSLEAALPGLKQALATLSPGSDIAVISVEEGYEIRVRRPTASPDACAPGWLSVYAVQHLGSMLGRGLRTANVAQNGAEVVVRARFREPAGSSTLAG